MTSRSRAVRIAGAIVAAAAIAAAVGSDRATASSPKVLRIDAAGYGLAVGPETVGLATYTAQVHNVGQYGVTVTIGPLLNVYVPPNAWRFRTITFARAGHYIVRAVGRRSGASSAPLTAQPDEK